jgi:chromosome segregation ATPase
VGLDGLQSEAIARIPVLESKICELSDALEASLHEKAALAAVVQSTMSLSHTQASTDSIEDALGTLIESLYVTVSNQQQSINALRAERDAIARARQEGRLRMDRTETRLLSLVESNETLQRTNQDLSDKLALAHISLRSACEEVSELTKKANPR